MSSTADPPARPAAPPTAADPPAVRHSRQLPDKILVAVHQACDQGEYAVAADLLAVLEMLLCRDSRAPGGGLRRAGPPDAQRRRNMDGLVAAHERLWHLRHPQAPG
jgi:hypothetical protein